MCVSLSEGVTGEWESLEEDGTPQGDTLCTLKDCIVLKRLHTATIKLAVDLDLHELLSSVALGN